MPSAVPKSRIFFIKTTCASFKNLSLILLLLFCRLKVELSEDQSPEIEIHRRCLKFQPR